ncbi:unnamed protein product, partial [Didymodactylos carnosus]
MEIPAAAGVPVPHM